jgi:predicted heme/steroid binding protein
MLKNILFAFVFPVLIALSFYYYYYSSKRFGSSGIASFPPPDWAREYKSPKVFTKEELATRGNGKNGTASLLTILGEIYDVTDSEYYREGSGYHVFIGQDATLAFVSGRFTEAAADDVSILDDTQIKSIEDWVKFYR